jgi:hypothetical protein
VVVQGSAEFEGGEKDGGAAVLDVRIDHTNTRVNGPPEIDAQVANAQGSDVRWRLHPGAWVRDLTKTSSGTESCGKSSPKHGKY